MPAFFSQRLLSVLQLTRMALVFTAVSNTLCSLLLLAQYQARAWGGDFREYLVWHRALAIAMMSVGLYGFGMSLNDIIDRRRDRQLAAHRPLPSGRIGVTTAHIVCAMLILLALLAGAAYSHLSGQGWISMLLVVWTALLILFYD